jgi:hypothetical protein
VLVDTDVDIIDLYSRPREMYVFLKKLGLGLLEIAPVFIAILMLEPMLDSV